MFSRHVRPILVLIVLTFIAPVAAGIEPVETSKVLKPGNRLVIIGDSITEQKLYSRYLEDYLTACTPQLNLWIMQLGWGGETAGGFLGRMDQDLLAFKPNVITTCYGMNDGQYRPYDEQTVGRPYAVNMKNLIDRAKLAGAIVVVGSPGAVDTKFFRNADAAKWYNDNLSHLKDLDKKLAADAKLPFADVHDIMVQTMLKAKDARGDDFPVCGRDGVHPGANGQLIMAYAFLKALGMDETIGVISVDMNGKAQGSDGHKIVASEAGKVTIESTHYPFCFSGDEKSDNSPRSILPYLPFQQDFNRLTLIVTNLKTEKAKVTWGKESKTFTHGQLESGVNLAAEFPNNPFSAAFQKVDDRVREKQEFETQMIKSHYRSLNALAAMADDDESKAAVTLLRKKLPERHAKLAEAVKAAVAPVQHTIEVVPE